jgi:hypothetical protein
MLGLDFLVIHNKNQLATLTVIEILNPSPMDGLMRAIQEAPEGPKLV